MQSFRQRLEHLSLRVTPAVITVLLVMFAAVPLRIPGAAQIMPIFALISIYYWGTFTPGTLPYLFLFALGLLEDTLTGTTMGVSSTINLGFALVLTWERNNFGKTLFGTLWLGFISLSLVAVMTEWLIMSISLGRMLPLAGHFLQWVATCLAYPPMHLIFTRIYRAMMDS